MKTASTFNLNGRVRTVLAVMAMMFGLVAIGCTDSKSESQPNNGGASSGPESKGGPVAKQPMDDDTIDGFWCAPHGLPEDECWKCNKEFCNQCEKNGDWCPEHKRPKSQCFKCDPKLIDAWALKYEARTGKKAPKPKNY